MEFTLRQARNYTGLSIQDVAKHVGKTPQTVSLWELGASRISAEDFLRLCRLYSRDPKDIILPKKSS